MMTLHQEMVQEIDVLREQVRMDHTAKRELDEVIVRLQETVKALRQACDEKNCIISAFCDIKMGKK